MRQDDWKDDEVVSALRNLIAEGGYGPGDRLPPERELISRLGMSRTVLRRALDALERDGVIWRHVGKGTFVSDGGEQDVSGDLVSISRQLTPVRMTLARLCIEPAIAREAAINASARAVQEINRAKILAREAADWSAYEARDDDFHRAIAEATDNVLLLSFFDQLNRVRRLVGWTTIVRKTTRPPADHSSFAEHERIASAIEARDPTAAYEAMRSHIGSVSARLFGEV